MSRCRRAEEETADSNGEVSTIHVDRDWGVVNSERGTVAVTVSLPGMLRRLYGIRNAQVVLPEHPTTLGAVIDALHARYPGIRDHLCTPDGRLREYILVFIGDRDSGRDPAAAQVPDGAEIHVVPSIAGGWDVNATGWREWSPLS